MSLKLTPWLLVSAISLVACGEKETDTAEEPSSEPTTEPSEPSATDPDPIAIDALGFSFVNGYQNNVVAGVSIPEFGTEPLGGMFTAILVSQVTGDSCVLDWTFDADTTAADAGFDDGEIEDGFGGANMEAWYGFEITSAPVIRAGYEDVCGNLDDFGQDIYDGLNGTTPVFGYGPMTADMAGYVEAGSADSSFTGFVGLDFMAQSGRVYFGLNQAFAYDINEDGTTTWDPAGQTYPQGTEIPAVDAAYAPGFYVANGLLSISWTAE